MNPRETERRKSVRNRNAKPQPVRVFLEEGQGAIQVVDANLVDMGADGLGIECNQPLPADLVVHLEGRENVWARVCWCRQLENGLYRAGLAVDANKSGNSRAEDSADYYDLLQLSPKAEPETIHRVFRMLTQRYHPDNGETGNAELFRQLVDAYRVLSDPEKRASYDVHRRTARTVQWRIFDRYEASRGVEAERRKREGILALLYTKRLNQPDQPAVSLRELEDILDCPREHLEFGLWYLRESGCISRADNARYFITAKGVDQAETSGAWVPSKDRLLTSGRGDVTAASSERPRPPCSAAPHP